MALLAVERDQRPGRAHGQTVCEDRIGSYCCSGSPPVSYNARHEGDHAEFAASRDLPRSELDCTGTPRSVAPELPRRLEPSRGRFQPCKFALEALWEAKLPRDAKFEAQLLGFREGWLYVLLCSLLLLELYLI